MVGGGLMGYVWRLVLVVTVAAGGGVATALVTGNAWWGLAVASGVLAIGELARRYYARIGGGSAAPAAARYILVPPPPPSPYDDLVRRAFANPTEGRLFFNPPKQMQLGQTERVEVRVARTLQLDTELLQGLRGHGIPHIEKIPTSSLMAVTLSSNGFDIKPLSNEEQVVILDGITTWEFDIHAKERGQQRLFLSVELRIPLSGWPLAHRSFPVREVTIDVQVTAVRLVGSFLGHNWQWVGTSGLAILAIIVGALFH